MARWQQMVESTPEFAERVQRRLDARIHKTIATIRSDGSPRISGIETFLAEGDLWIGSMPDARKALDLRRDPRFALHSGSIDPADWEGDAKIAGHVEEVTDLERRAALFRTRGTDPPSPASHLFRLDIAEAVLIGLNEARDRLVIELWRPGEEVKRIERE